MDSSLIRRTIADQVSYLGGLLPNAGLEIIEQQLKALVSRDAEALSVGFLVGLAIALWSANNGIKAVFDAMNVAYEEVEKRSFVRLNLTSAMFTLGAIVIATVMLLAVGIVPAMLALLHLEGWTEVLIAFARWPLLLASIWLGISLIYRYGPSRHNAKWRWLNWGSILATVVWLSASAGLFILSAEFCQLRRHLWFAWGRHRPDDVDLDIGNHPHRRGRDQRRDGASDRHRYDRRPSRSRWASAARWSPIRLEDPPIAR